MKRSGRKPIIILITIFLICSILVEILLIFNITLKQTKDSGKHMVESTGEQFESIIMDAENSTLEFAMKAQACLDDKEALEKLVFDTQEKLEKESEGECFNAYIAAPDWSIIPGLTSKEDFEPTERIWYVKAIGNDGKVYVTSPYNDVVTGKICYTFSVALNDSQTVVATDYTMENIAAQISKLNTSGTAEAVIVTDDGVIAGCTDEKLIGKALTSELPDYAGIFALVKENDETVTIQQNQNSIFALRSDFGWCIIVSENNFTLYKTTYIQILGMSLLLLIIFAFIILMYYSGVRSAKQAHYRLDSRDRFIRKSISDIRDPIAKISANANSDQLKHSAKYREEINAIREASAYLSDKLNELVAYSSLMRDERITYKKVTAKEIRSSRKFRAILLFALMILLTVCTYINFFAATNYGMSLMEREAAQYEYRLSSWICEQKSILDMFCSIISTDPEILEDYDKTIKMLDDITKQYPAISVSYMTNPEREHTVYMNNGWEPDSNWHVEERDWYISTNGSEEGWSISSPYYDAQTGYYCVTLSERVYDAKTGKFLGIFGIDFYMDKLTQILGSSYSDSGYAFLADAAGNIINHPYGIYQMSENGSTNVFSLPYGEADPKNEELKFIKDYDGSFKALIANRNAESNFTVYVVKTISNVYRDVIIYNIASVLVMIICIILVYRLISNLIKLQESANIKLKESAEAAIAADEAKSSFLAQMSHEIRTPINAILGMNEMILRESSSSEIREYAFNIQSAGRTLLSLINSILDFSKIEDGKMEIIPVKYDTATMIHDLVSTVQSRAKEKGLELIVKADAALPAVLKGDDVRVKQVISNLLTNAVKYTEEGTITLIIRCESQHDDTAEIYVEVTDTGIGIKEEDLGALFESFKRLDEKRNRNIEGTGLGMTIVTRLLEMMDSKLDVKSVYGKGSTFSFRLKQKIESPAAMGDYNKRIIKSDVKSRRGRHMYSPDAKVLFVDDNEMNIKVDISLVKLFGIVPDTSFSGSDAIKLIEKKHYDIVFMDHMMPKLDGIETLKILREKKLIDESTAVIALTANAIEGAREMYVSEGFSDYLTKPIESNRLEKALETYLPEKLVKYRTVSSKNITEHAEEEPAKEEPVKEEASDSFTLEELGNIRGKCPALDVLAGLSYCMDSKEFYLDTLDGYLGADKSDEMEKAFGEKDIKNYGILAHSLKSTSLTIGAVLLSDHAKNLEFAAKQNDDKFIEKNHASVMSEYHSVLDGIKEVLGK